MPLAAAERRWDRARAWLREAIQSTRVEVGADASAAPDARHPFPLRVAFPAARTDRDISQLAQEVFALPARLAQTRRRRVVVALDEFQAIGGFNGGSVEHALRAAVQQQRDVGYVFAGSEPSLMERMLGPKRPFYKAGPVMRLEKIPPGEFAEFIEARFNASGIKAEAGLGAAVVEVGEDVVQRAPVRLLDLGEHRGATLVVHGPAVVRIHQREIPGLVALVGVGNAG